MSKPLRYSVGAHIYEKHPIYALPIFIGLASGNAKQKSGTIDFYIWRKGI